MKSNISTKHPLIGTWITSDEDSDATFIIGVKDGKAFCKVVRGAIPFERIAYTPR